jgi:hypothetical protein
MAGRFRCSGCPRVKNSLAITGFVCRICVSCVAGIMVRTTCTGPAWRSKISLPVLRNRAEGGERLCGRPKRASGGGTAQRGIGDELVRMRAFNALPGALPVASAGVPAHGPAGVARCVGAGLVERVGAGVVRCVGTDVVGCVGTDVVGCVGAGASAGVNPGANVMPVAYNPDGGKRVQLAWQRFSNSPRYRPGARPCVHPADSAAPACPAGCR